MSFKCNLCEKHNGKVLANADQIRFGCYGYDKKIIECCDCGLVQLYPQWTKKELEDMYEKYSLKKDFDGYKPVKTITRYLPTYISKKDFVLEIGCGRGDNVKWLKGKGYDVIGIDRDPSVQDYNNVLNYEFEEFEIWKQFDFIYAIHVLEHVEEPISFLNKIVDGLADGGKCLLEIPNVEDPLLTLYKNKAYEKFAWYPYHIYCYSAKTIKDLMGKIEGLDVKIIRKQRYGVLNHLRWLIKGKPGNINFHIPFIDDIYKIVLTKVFKVSDTLVVFAQKKY